MPYAAWLLFVAITGWAAGEIVGGDHYGRLTDVLLGISGALLVRFVVESAGIRLDDIYLLLFSFQFGEPRRCQRFSDSPCGVVIRASGIGPQRFSALTLNPHRAITVFAAR